MGLDYCFIPDELYLTRKMSDLPEFVFQSNPPPVLPVTKILPEESVVTPSP